MTPEEKNAIIAAFLGWATDGVGYIAPVEYERYKPFRTTDGGFLSSIHQPEELRFNISWDWLMPVIERITADPKWDEFNDQRLWDELCTFSINGCFEVAVDFITWLNQK